MTTDPSDIVERLLDVADLDARAGEPLGKACREAAAEITRLRAALADVKERYAKVTDEDREIARRWLSEGQINVDQMGRAAVLVAIRQEYQAALAEQDAEIERLRAALADVKERCAKVAEEIGEKHLQWSKMNLPVEPSPIIAKDRADVAKRIAAAIRALE